VARVPVHFYRQSGVIAYRLVASRLEVLLITTRKGHWTIPKGVVEPELSPAQSAAQEAFEEAGVRGRVSDRSIGRFEYPKWGGVCRVEVFLMEVREEAAHWPEEKFRRRAWLDIPTAAARIRFARLAALIRQAARALAPPPVQG
jgi:8-oxo-dGTP pyrophosphatase MutT (NUDIX family)